MKILLILIILLILCGTTYFIYLGFKSQTGEAIGMVNSQLSPCPGTPNCICSEYPADQAHYIEAIQLNSENESIIQDTIKNSIEKTGGVISNVETNYISATYTSSIFRYVDDFEIRIDIENNLIHIRSASRVGRSDFGANLKRINAFKQQLLKGLLANPN